MPIPDFQSIMLPLLRLLEDGQEHSLREAIAHLQEEFGLSEEERKQLLPSGQELTFRNRVAWARTYLKQAELLEAPRRGWIRVTPRGREVLAEKPKRIDVRFLERFEEFRSFLSRLREKEGQDETDTEPTGETSEELLERGYERLRQNLKVELLDQIKKSLARIFRTARRPTAGQHGLRRLLRRSGTRGRPQQHGGINGIINEDRLGLDVVYVQAKHWEAPVGRPELQKFAGALQRHRARKGVFITTSIVYSRCNRLCSANRQQDCVD